MTTPGASTRGGFAWDDPFLLEDQLTDEEKMIRDVARGCSRSCA